MYLGSGTPETVGNGLHRVGVPDASIFAQYGSSFGKFVNKSATVNPGKPMANSDVKICAVFEPI